MFMNLLQFVLSKYRVERISNNLKVHYWVKEDFRPEFKSDLRRIERNVEEEYIGQLRSNCFRERNYSKLLNELLRWQSYLTLVVLIIIPFISFSLLHVISI